MSDYHTGLLSSEKADLIRNELDSFETLKWCAEPDPGKYAIRGLPMTFFGIPFTTFSVFWIFGAAGFKFPDFSEGGFSFFPLFGLPFFIVGISIMLTPLWYYLKAKKSIYAITNKRAIIFEGIKSMTIRSFYANDLTNLVRKQKSDGSGNIIFKKEYSSSGNNNKTQMKEIGFIGIKDVKNIEDLLNNIVKNAREK